MFAKAQRVHFIGIGGIGMSGIAEILLNLGYAVSGSDLALPRHRAAGRAWARPSLRATRPPMWWAPVVVVSSAVNESNPEVVEARSARCR